MRHTPRVPAPFPPMPTPRLRDVLDVLKLPPAARAQACERLTPAWWETALQLLEEALTILQLFAQQPGAAQASGRPGSQTPHARLHLLMDEIEAAEALDTDAPAT